MWGWDARGSDTSSAEYVGRCSCTVRTLSVTVSSLMSVSTIPTGLCPLSRPVSGAHGRPPAVATFPPWPAEMRTADLLAQVPLFSACSKKELQQLAKLAQDIHVDAGHVVVRKGAAGAEFFAIVDGRGRGEPPRQGRGDARAGCVLRRPRAPRQGAPQRDRHRARRRWTSSSWVSASSASILDDSPVFVRKLLVGLAHRLREMDLQDR